MAEGNGTARQGLWISALSAGGGLLAALFVLYAQITSTTATANETKERLERLSAQIAEMRVDEARVVDKQTEIDTQLRATIDEDNKTLAWQMRINAMLWEHTFKGSHLPTDNAFYPNIAEGRSQ